MRSSGSRRDGSLTETEKSTPLLRYCNCWHKWSLTAFYFQSLPLHSSFHSQCLQIYPARPALPLLHPCQHTGTTRSEGLANVVPCGGRGCLCFFELMLERVRHFGGILNCTLLCPQHRLTSHGANVPGRHGGFGLLTPRTLALELLFLS